MHLFFGVHVAPLLCLNENSCTLGISVETTGANGATPWALSQHANKGPCTDEGAREARGSSSQEQR